LKCIFLISNYSLVRLEMKRRINWRFQSNHLSNVRAFAFAIVIFLWLWIKCKVKLHLHVFFSFSPSVPSIIILNIFGFFCVDMQLEGSLASANPWKSPLAFPSSKLNQIQRNNLFWLIVFLQRRGYHFLHPNFDLICNL